MLPKRLRSSRASTSITTTSVAQQTMNMVCGLTSSDTGAPNRVEGQSTFMPSAPPVTPRERDAVRKAICPTARVSMPKATPGIRTITRPIRKAIRPMAISVRMMAASAGINCICRMMPMA